MQEDKQIISSAVDALTGKKVFSFDLANKKPEIVKRTLLDKLLRRPIVEPVLTRHFDIYPCVVANQYRIAGKALSLPTDFLDDETILLSYVPEHLPTMIYIIAAAIQNDYLEPEEELIVYLERNLDNIDVLSILGASLQQTNMQSFLTSIVLMNGTAKMLNPKETSPLDGRESIASHNTI